MDISRYRRYGRVIAPALRSRKVKAYGILVLSLLTASFFGVFAIRPTTSTIAQLRRQIKDNQYVDQKLTEKINALTALDRTYKQIKNDLVYVEASLPSQANLQNLLVVLEEAAGDNQLEIVSAQMRPVDLVDSQIKEDDFQPVPMSFKIVLKGSYPDLSRGLVFLNEASRLITIETVEIKKTKQPREAEAEALTLELEGKSFYVN